jgi:hypothetical protein
LAGLCKYRDLALLQKETSMGLQIIKRCSSLLNLSVSTQLQPPNRVNGAFYSVI